MNAIVNAFNRVIGPHLKHSIQEITNMDFSDTDNYRVSDLAYAIADNERLRIEMRKLKDDQMSKIIGAGALNSSEVH